MECKVNGTAVYREPRP